MKPVVREFLQTSLLAAALFLVLQSVVQTFRVEQRSMEPTLREGQYLLVSKAAYLDLGAILTRRASAAEARSSGGGPLREPERGDIVVFRHPRSPGQYLIKRVVGLPGETVEVSGGRVRVDGVALDEAYLGVTTDYRMAPRTVPLGEYFVLGDNRNNSFDSHVFGTIPRDLILGRAIPLPYVSLAIGRP